MDHFVELELVDQDQVVARSGASHSEVGELTCAGDTRQGIEASEDIAGGASGAANLFPAKAGRSHRSEPGRTRGFGRNDNLFDRLRPANQLEVCTSNAIKHNARFGLFGVEIAVSDDTDDHQAFRHCREFKYSAGI